MTVLMVPGDVCCFLGSSLGSLGVEGPVPGAWESQMWWPLALPE